MANAWIIMHLHCSYTDEEETGVSRRNKSAILQPADLRKQGIHVDDFVGGGEELNGEIDLENTFLAMTQW